MKRLRAWCAILAVAMASPGCGGEPDRAPAGTRDTVFKLAMTRPESAGPRLPAAGAPVALEPKAQVAAGLPGVVVDGRPLLVVRHSAEELADINLGVVIALDSVMGYVGAEIPEAAGWVPPDEQDPWARRVEWGPIGEARAMVRDSAARLGIRPNDTYWVVGPSGVTPAIVATVQPGQNECGRPSGIAVSLTGGVAALPPGVYYATADRAAAERVRRVNARGLAPEVARDALAVLDVDGDGVADTRLTRAALVQRRPGDTAYVAVDRRIGIC